MEKFYKFIQNIEKQLQKPLPGRAAHLKMAPSSRLNNLEFLPNERTRKSAILILFYPYLNEIYLPLILRPAYDGVHGGQMAFPGGRMEKEDESLIRTALREAQEEIGVKLTDIKVLGTLTEQFIPPSNFFVLPVIGYLTHKPDFYPDAREVDKVIELTLPEIQDPSIVGVNILNVRGVEVQAPFYNIQDNHVWGATAMMIAELLEVCGLVDNGEFKIDN